MRRRVVNSGTRVPASDAARRQPGSKVEAF